MALIFAHLEQPIQTTARCHVTLALLQGDLLQCHAPTLENGSDLVVLVFLRTAVRLQTLQMVFIFVHLEQPFHIIVH